MSFEPLVHESRGIDGDLRAHGPVRVAQRVLRRCARNFLSVGESKRAAGRRYGDHFHIVARRGGQGLEDGVVFAVHGEQLGAGARRLGHEESACGDEALLVGKGDTPTRTKRRKGGREPGNSRNRAEHDIRVPPRRFQHRGSPCPMSNAAASETRGKPGTLGFVGDGDEGRAEGQGEVGQRVGIPPARQGNDPESLGASATSLSALRPTEPWRPAGTRFEPS